VVLDPEQSDTQIPTSSPPQSGDEIRTKVSILFFLVAQAVFWPLISDVIAAEGVGGFS
jgi:hypothetical protein